MEIVITADDIYHRKRIPSNIFFNDLADFSVRMSSDEKKYNLPEKKIKNYVIGKFYISEVTFCGGCFVFAASTGETKLLELLSPLENEKLFTKLSKPLQRAKGH